MREKIIEGNIYHVVNRGVEGRRIFQSEKDYLRFVHDLFEFNDEAPAPNLNYIFANKKSPQLTQQYLEVGLPNIVRQREPRKLLVELLAFTLMPNHYHLLVRPRSDGGMAKFMQKLNTGYTNYFNTKYEHRGVLFMGKYKAIVIKDEKHFIHLPYYIHFNPLDLQAPTWRERKLKNAKKAIDFLRSYRWSSHIDYCGIKNFPSVTQRDFLLNFFGGTSGYRNAMEVWLHSMNFEHIKDLALE